MNNEQIVLEAIRQSPYAVTIRYLAGFRTHLTVGTVRKHIKELLIAGRIVEAGKGRARGSPMRYKLPPGRPAP